MTTIYVLLKDTRVGPGPTISPLCAAQGIRSRHFFPHSTSHFLVQLSAIPIDAIGDVITFASWVARLGNRPDVNLAAFGDRKITEVAKACIADFEYEKNSPGPESDNDISDLMQKHAEIIQEKLKPYAHFFLNDAGYGIFPKQPDDDHALIVASGFFDPRAIQEKIGGLVESCQFSRVDFVNVIGKFGPSPFFISISDGLKIIHAFSIKRTRAKQNKAIALCDADAVFFSSPFMFYPDFLGAIVLVALRSNINTPIYVYGCENHVLKMYLTQFITKIDVVRNEIWEKGLDEKHPDFLNQICALSNRLKDVIFPEFSSHQKPNLTAAIQAASRPAVFAEGIGTLQLVSEAEKNFLMQPTPYAITVDRDTAPGMQDALKSKCIMVQTRDDQRNLIYGDHVIQWYRNAFRKFSFTFANMIELNSVVFDCNPSPPSEVNLIQEIKMKELKDALEILLTTHDELGPVLQLCYQQFLDDLTIIGDEPLSAYYYRLMENKVTEKTTPGVNNFFQPGPNPNSTRTAPSPVG